MTVYVKPNGTEIDVHDNSIEYAKKLGWKLKAAKAEQKKKLKKAE